MSVESPDLLREIVDLNLTYLLLAQRLLREDYATALVRLQVNEKVADLILSLSSSQIAHLARTNQLLLHSAVLEEIARIPTRSNGPADALAPLHSAILQSSRSANAQDSKTEETPSKEKKSLLDELREVQLAIELIELGARLQVLESETAISRSRLIRLYKEIRGMSPPKGMLPFSTGWFVTWLPNIHSSLFYNYFRNFSACQRMEAFTKAYRLYLEQTRLSGSEPVLGLTRAWTLVRYFESGLFDLARCRQCGGSYVVHAHTPARNYACGICRPPSRAGKIKKHKTMPPPPAEERLLRSNPG